MLGVCEPRLTQVLMNCVDVVVGAVGAPEIADLKLVRARLAVRADNRTGSDRTS